MNEIERAFGPIDGAAARWVSPVVVGLVRARAPRDVYVFEIERWFGPKWLGFKGKIMGAAGVVRDVTRGDLPVPPFVPTRIRSQQRFERTEDGYSLRGAPTLHERRHSESNLQRRLADESRDGVFVWWTRGSDGDARAALMIAVTRTDRQQEAWYIGLVEREGVWAPTARRNVSANEIRALAEVGAASA